MENQFIMPLWASIPFGIMLLAIAIGPLVMEHWWERNLNKFFVSLILGIPTAVFLISNGLTHELQHQMLFDYVPFIILLCSLFVITGGINLSGDIQAKPSINTLFLGIGFLLASIMGTTGAAMLLIRPVIATNQERKFKVHTILFFIALIANCGGLLTPLGDPPLFLLYLRGADFTWFLQLLPEWAFVGVLLLVIYYFTDRYFYKRESKEDIMADNTNIQPLRLSGCINFVYLLCVILAVAFINVGYIPAMGEKAAPFYIKFLREIILIVLIVLSVFTTPKSIRSANKFTWTPILEVAAVFLGIFITMVPALLYLKENAGSLGLQYPWQFFYSTGALSSFLDNAPTAVAFHGVALGLVEQGITPAEVAGISEILLKTISLAAVFFGAMTYIGNGPNFMVKAIAEESGIKMPGFFGYMIRFSLVVLLPIFILVQLIFL
ncbi:MAG: sodium:proton antiporter [Bacteroidales bacterium]|nr:sodium:proton antiporter [Bacteroidales bacterium]